MDRDQNETVEHGGGERMSCESAKLIWVIFLASLSAINGIYGIIIWYSSVYVGDGGLMISYVEIM